MQCPKCGQENAGGVQFCTRCHATLFFKCPVCWHTQATCGRCEKCGTDYAAYATACIEQSASEEQKADIDRFVGRTSWLAQLALAPLSGGRSLLRLLFGRIFARLFVR